MAAFDGSAVADDAFILPYKDFMDFFTEDLLDGAKRWVGNIRNEEIRISAGGVAHARAVQQYYNAFNLIQDAPTPLPKKLDISEFA